MDVNENPPTKQGIIAQAIGAAGTIAAGLPPAFIALLFINVLFLSAVFILVDRVSQQRSTFTDHLLTACMQTFDRMSK